MLGEGLLTVLYYLIAEEVELEDAIDFAHDNNMGTAPEPETDVRGEENAGVVETNMTDARSKDDRHV